MRAADLKDKKVVIWGLGREGKAAAAFIRKALPDVPLVLADEAEGPDKIDGLPTDCRIVRGAAQIEAALDDADVVVKSPGVSLYHPLLQRLKNKGVVVTSLLNLWAAEPRSATTIFVTGTKGKSTTSALLTHVLNGLGKKAAVGGNIGVPVADIPSRGVDYAVVEVSSYQAADFSGACDIAILTSLHPEHLDWHGSAEVYFADKLNLLAHAKTKIVNAETLDIARRHGLVAEGMIVFNRPDGLHAEDGKILDGGKIIGAPRNAHLARPHNLSNICAVLAVIKLLGLDLAAALRAMENFQGLPHRQQELGEKDGVLYVNDSIATVPHAAIAALDVYRTRPVTLIAGGYDRGIDYTPLTDYILANGVHAVICLGASGMRIYDALKKRREERIFAVASLPEAVVRARAETPQGGVILLSPAAPSYGMFHDFTERGERFAAECGFKIAAP
jgi:UDP-N-acetylmuramoylalanine--D-glutamate ligase